MTGNPQRQRHEALIEAAAKAIFEAVRGPRTDYVESEWPNYQWENWPETPQQASLSQREHSRQEYRNQARAVLPIIAERLSDMTGDMKAAGRAASLMVPGNALGLEHAPFEAAYHAVLGASALFSGDK